MTADKGADVAREAIDRTEGTARRSLETAQRTAGAGLEVERAAARRSAEGIAELGQAFAELVKEQARSNAEAFEALTRAVDWDRVSRTRASCCAPAWSGRCGSAGATSKWCRRCIASVASMTKEQARKAA